MANNNNNMIRMSGMNSGLDTESIINALTANSKLKITKQNRQLLKYQATQEAYRDVISKLQSLKSKYFNLANPKGNLSGTSMWSQYKTTTSVNGDEKKIAGFSATTTVDSVAGDYKMVVKNTATQSTLSGSSLSSGAKLDMSALNAGDTYGLSITVGTETKNITFTADADPSKTIENINDQLRELYGESNASTDGSSELGLVYIDEATGSFVSREGKGITLSGTGKMVGSAVLDLTGLQTGNNTVAIQIGDEVINVSFQTLANDYFTPEKDENGNDLPLSKEKQELYDQIKDDYVEFKKYQEYQDWAANTTDEDKEALKLDAFAKAEQAQSEKFFDKFENTKQGKSFLEMEYNLYKFEQMAKGEESMSFAAWKKDETIGGAKLKADALELVKAGDKDNTSNNYYNAFKNYYYDRDIPEDMLSEDVKAERNEKLDNYLNTQYETYRDGLIAEGEVPDGFDGWKDANFVEGTDLYAGYQKIADKYNKYTGYQLDLESWTALSYNEYSAYKDAGLGTVTEESLGITAQDVIDHYNTTSLQNSIGAAETKSGVKLSVDVTGGAANVTAEDQEGNPVDFSITAARGSDNTFGIAQATTSISQISNSTKLYDLGLTPDSDGTFNFTINGVSFSFTEDTTVKDMMRKVSASEANVKMSYSSLDNAFTISANEYGVNSSIEMGDDPQGFLAAIGLGASAVYEQGSNLEVEINGRLLESNGNSVTVDGTTFSFAGVASGTEFDVTVEKDYSAITDTIKSFVEEYNKLIEDVYKLLDEKPDKDYYFLADADKEDLDLSEKQEEKWEAKAKLGLLYHDSTISSVMTKLRTSLMGTTEAADGKTISLKQLGITTATDYKEHGKLFLDESALQASVMEYGEDIIKLFTDKENGIMTKFSEALEYAVGTTGDKGTLINKAGLATGTSATNNFIYNQMKRITSRISTLEKRYENEQSRLWKKYSSMEKMLGKINSQSASLSSYFGGGTM